MMKPLSREQYETWLKTAEVLEQDGHGVKVLRLADGTFLKLFRRKSWFSKTVLFPPAKRFAANAVKLEKLGIPCPKVIQLYKLKKPYRSVVHYLPLEGETLRKMAESNRGSLATSLIKRLADFIRELHDHGVYFRSLHLGNIVLTPQGRLGLIDISDMQCTGKTLSARLRRRNMEHLFRYTKEWDQQSREQIVSLLKGQSGKNNSAAIQEQKKPTA